MDAATDETPRLQFGSIPMDAEISSLQFGSIQMDAATGYKSSLQHDNIAESEEAQSPIKKGRQFDGNESTGGEFPLSATPSIVLHVLTACNVSPQDLAKLEVTCSFFRRPANFDPNHNLSIAELASLDMCEKRFLFKTMSVEQQEDLKQKCGGSWKLVLKFFLAREACLRRGKTHAIAGPGHSIVVTSKGDVYSFGCNKSSELGHEATEREKHPRLIRSLQGIRIVHATTGSSRTLLITETGQVYGVGLEGTKLVTTPQVVESLKDIFVVQAVIAYYFTAVLSREGRAYVISWGDDRKHSQNPDDVEPIPLLGALENKPVVQIAAGHCYLLALACESGRMSVYSLGCGLGGKLGTGSTTGEKQPQLIERFQTLNLEPVALAAGLLHAVVLGKDGRVCTWGWGSFGCLGHGKQVPESVPTVVEALSNVKAIHVAAGTYTTFVVSDNGDVYSFGCHESECLGHDYVLVNDGENAQYNFPESNGQPMLITSLKRPNEKVVYISTTNSAVSNSHTFALTESEKLYAFGNNNKGQLGIELEENEMVTVHPKRVNIALI